MANLGEGLDWLSSVNNCVLCLDPHHDWISTGGPPCSMSSHLILHVVAPHREGLFLLWDGDERLLLSECGSCFLVIQQKRSVFFRSILFFANVHYWSQLSACPNFMMSHTREEQL